MARTRTPARSGPRTARGLPSGARRVGTPTTGSRSSALTARTSASTTHLEGITLAGYDGGNPNLDWGPDDGRLMVGTSGWDALLLDLATGMYSAGRPRRARGPHQQLRLVG